MYERILLPTDGSDASLAAAAHAGSLSRTTGATVHVVSVADSRNRFESPSSGLAPDAWREAENERATAAIEKTIGELPEAVETERTVVTGIPQDEIVDLVEEAAADVVVMGTHGRAGIDRYLIGSVTERVVRRSPVPVLTVQGTRGQDDSATSD
ncbi:universal stress protein [Halobellus limi]|jgi:nucleotide-binding universal stress UspA family protein|uniref:Universal stress protein n=1 Tax=Halobellus limi TaxID=699433 RepID=A0A1H5WUF1_9EURY|nr:universal stress protein [Halobellus limi]QCC46335.1 universal stress protein [Halobellus limi]SEG03081.1 Nucleotide-binding universal stress protein, UspA family [Halobellus limi]